MNIKILLEKNADNQYVASIPALEGCQSRAETREEALHNISETIHSYFESKFAETEKPENGEIIELAI
ncbi:MAG TPA: type II toxin-antitoxin system HicB family antitoxin [Pyrinomonadaceae bacterium]|nr:type II toxin-antitoxin system HicB family antitoxin [Pyrinomonadaceae bacterium]